MKFECFSVCHYQDKGFFLSNNSEALLSYDRQSGDVTLYGLLKNGLTLVSVVIGKKIYMLPYNGNVMKVFDLETEEFEEAPFEFEADGYKLGSCSVGCAYHDEIFILCGSANIPLCSYNVVSGQFKDRSAWRKEFFYKKGRMPEITVYRNPCIVGNDLWLAIDEPDTLLQYNMDTDQYKFWKIGDQGTIYNTVNFDGKYFWLTGDVSAIIKWNPEIGELQNIDRFPELYSTKKETEWTGNFWNGIYDNGYIYYAPLNSNMLIRVDVHTGKPESILQVGNENVCFVFSKINTEEIYMEIKSLKSGSKENAFLLDIKNGSVREFDLEFDYGKGKCKIGNKAKKYMYLKDMYVSKFDCLEMLIDLVSGTAQDD